MKTCVGAALVAATLLLLVSGCSSGGGKATITTTMPNTAANLQGNAASRVAVPNVVGKGQLDAAYALLRAHLHVKAASRSDTGNVKVTEQTPAAGDQVLPGTVVTLKIASPR